MTTLEACCSYCGSDGGCRRPARNGDTVSCGLTSEDCVKLDRGEELAGGGRTSRGDLVEPSPTAIVIDHRQRLDMGATLFHQAVASYPRRGKHLIGVWSLTDVVIHMAAWLEEGARRVNVLRIGASCRPLSESDVDAFNDAAVTAAQAASTTIKQAERRCDEAFEAFSAAIDKGPVLSGSDVEGWLVQMGNHLLHHAAELKAVRG
jgi:hypothetical protein